MRYTTLGYLHCVERYSNGVLVWYPLANQDGYREWVGVFTSLPSNYFTREVQP